MPKADASPAETGENDPQIAGEDLGAIDDRPIEDAATDEEQLWNEIRSAQREGKPTADEPPTADAEDPDENAVDEKTAGDDADSQPADLWAGATSEQRAAFEALKQKVDLAEQYRRSNEGRIAAFQRQIEQLERQRPTADSRPADSQQAGKDFLASDEWRKFSEEYPEVAEPMAKVVGALSETVTRLERGQSAIDADRRQSAFQAQAELLTKEHPDWTEVIADQTLTDWLAQQPRHIQEAAIRNSDNIVDAREAADVVGRFKVWRDAQNGQARSQPSAGNGHGAHPTKPALLSAKRERQLESASAPPSRSRGATPSGIPEAGDEETLWRQIRAAQRAGKMP